MQPRDDHQEHHEDLEAAPRAEVGTGGPSPAGVDASGPEPACSDPTEVFPLDYDRELAYLEHEGKLRGRRRPTGFKA